MNRRVEERLVLKRSIKIFINRVLITTIIVLICLIGTKNNPDIKKLLKENIYESSFNFNKAKTVYEKYFGDVLSMEKKIKETNQVFGEKINYIKADKYNNGVNLEVSNNYMIPVLESGVIVYVGQKNGYNNTVIIDQVDGVETLYGNVKISNYKLYDYIEKGELLGEVEANKVFISFQKEGKFLDYKKYL